MPLTLCESVSHRFRRKPPNWTSLANVTFKFILVLKLRLVFINSFANMLSYVRFPCSKNCSPISLLAFFHTSSIILFTKTLIMNQFIQLAHLFLHSIPTIRPTFPKYLLPYFLYFFMQLQNFYHEDRHQT